MKTATPVLSNPPKPGDTITYNFSITNTGNTTLTGSQLTDALVGYTNATCGVTSLAPGPSTACSASYTITQADIDAGSVTNTATACATPPIGSAICDIDIKIVIVPQTSHISLTKTASPTTYTAAGQPINYTLVAKNDGNVTLSNVSISDPMLSVLVCTPPQPATLGPGGTLTCTGSYTTTSTDVTNGKVVNNATASGSGPQSSQVLATASQTVVYNGDTDGRRMTGGGSVFTGENGFPPGIRVTHGFELHCEAVTPNRLEINWDKGNNFHLTSLTSATCSDDPTITPNPPGAGFDTYVGSGTGVCNGLAAAATWTFTDAGEPGKNDTATINITGGCTLSVSGNLNSGNQQAHGQ